MTRLFADLSLWKKLLISTLITVTAFCSLGAFLAVRSAGQRAILESLLEDGAAAQQIAALKQDALALNQTVYRLIIMSTSGFKQEEIKAASLRAVAQTGRLAQSAPPLLARLRQRARNAEALKRLELVARLLKEFQTSIRMALDMVEADATLAVMQLQPNESIFARFDENLTALLDEQNSDNTRTVEGALAAIRHWIWLTACLAPFVLAFALGSSLWLARAGIARPLAKAVAVLERLREGDLSVRLGTTSRDEVGQMGVALDAALDSIGEALRAVRTCAGQLTATATTMASLGAQLDSSARRAQEQSTSAAAAAEEVSRTAGEVARSSEAIGVSIHEIAKNAAEGSAAAGKAANGVAEANETIGRLATSSVKIGDVVKLISSIAEQTNLLALNATIEAARAGAAGKGFAVVASEVKELARQTAQATDDIGHRVGAIQADSKGAVEAVGTIAKVIAQVDQLQGTIAAAVEEQAATTSETTRSIGEAATASTSIARAITSVAEEARTTTAAAKQSRSAADQLSAIVATLDRHLGGFRLEQRS